MACGGCRKQAPTFVLPMDGSPPDEFPTTTPDGMYVVTPEGGASYSFDTLGKARTAADMIGGTITTR